MTPELSNAVYDILVQEAGASETARERFVDEWPSLCPVPGFIRTLGASGAFWYDPDSNPYAHVTVNSIEWTPERQAIINRTNKLLAELMEGTQ